MSLRLAVSTSLVFGVKGHGWVDLPASRGVLGCDPITGYTCEAHQATMSACDNLPCEGCQAYLRDGNCTPGAYPGLATPEEPFCNPKQSVQNVNLTTPGKVSATWKAGSIVEVAWVVSVNHKGYYQYRLCLDGSDTEECFKKTPLKFEDGKLWHWLDSPCSTCNGTAPDHGASVPRLADRIVIPDNVQCDRCTLGWRWDAYMESTIFTGCADVTVTAGCPGGSLKSCIGLCPSSPDAAFRICTETCLARCNSAIVV